MRKSKFKLSRDWKNNEHSSRDLKQKKGKKFLKKTTK
jgi:hypothetical protein